MIRGSQCPRGGSRALGVRAAFGFAILALSMALPRPAAAAVTWIATGPLATVRYGHTATLLPNGKVLVAGGYNGGALKSSELYDPVARTWSPTTGSLSVGRWNHTATLLNTGKVLVAGGGPTQCELYDPSTGTWSTTGAGALTTGRSNHTATLLPNDTVLVAGGYDAINQVFLNSAELYDPTGGAGAPPAPSLPAAGITRPHSLTPARSWWRGAITVVP